MHRRRTLPSAVKWRPTQSTDERCLRCGSWPDQRLHPAALQGEVWLMQVWDDDGRTRHLTLCPTCASRVPGNLLVADAGWETMRPWWPVRGRRVPEVTLAEIHPLDIETGPAMMTAAERLTRRTTC